MQIEQNRAFGAVITRLIQKENLSRKEAKKAFAKVLNNEISEMQQGAFLAALTSKGETEDEVAGSFEAIYDIDTKKVTINGKTPLVENSGTGMDTFKTFNISTAASLIASAGKIRMARHGARAITSQCGTVDMAESLGVDVECSAGIVAKSIDTAGIGLFNGMSPEIHPKALGRILSRINFGSTLNVAASLANPALPKTGVRGVYSKKMIIPVIRVMKAIGYKRAIVLHGGVAGSDKGMDEASVCGTTWCAELSENGAISEYSFAPARFGMGMHDSLDLAPQDTIEMESKRFVALIQGRENGARREAAILNAGLIYYLADRADTIDHGIEKASQALLTGKAFNALENWVAAQNRDPEKGLKKLERLV
ncbi:MAG: anthranilate phosphoribosyltransferase [Thermodesulfobacteriota bacterium]|nr:anthranilate phosphoribosyltransferase [Thermodesulfobacteriota bacterium]